MAIILTGLNIGFSMDESAVKQILTDYIVREHNINVRTSDIEFTDNGRGYDIAVYAKGTRFPKAVDAAVSSFVDLVTEVQDDTTVHDENRVFSIRTGNTEYSSDGNSD